MSTKPYTRALVFSGGGTRYATYCGMFAALEESGMRPDLVISTCGGSIATAVINSFATNDERKDFLMSQELYKFATATSLTRQQMLYRIGWYCLRKMCSPRRAPYIENIFDRYLVEMPSDVSALLPSLTGRWNDHVDAIIVGAKVLYDKSLVGKPRNGAKLYRKVFLTDPRTAQQINHTAAELQSDNFRQSALDNRAETVSDIDLVTAMRISVSDMFYVPPVELAGNYYVGGVVDLVPLELATSLAKTVIAEHKEGYGKLENALIRAVFGFDANERMTETDNIETPKRVDTTDIRQALKGHYMAKKIELRKLKVELTKPLTHKEFATDMALQWQYGYDKIIEMVKSS